MKKVLVSLVILMVLASGVAFGQTTDSASLFLSGVVGEFVSITINPTTAAQSLPLNQEASTPILVAEVVYTSNTDYNITVSSANGFELVSTAGGEHPYTMQFNGTAIAQSGDSVTSGTFANNVSRDVTVTYAAADPNLATGTYTDTVTFTIEATN